MIPADNRDPATTCPQCGRDNACAVAAGEAVQACWCHAVTMEPATLARATTKAGSSACLCRTCALPEGSTNDEG